LIDLTNKDHIIKLIQSDGPRQAKLSRQAAYVRGENPAILAPYPKEEPDNRIPVPFVKRGINMVVGYALKEGNVVYKGDGYDDSLKEIYDANDEGLLDAELGATALAHGFAYELHWSEGGKDQFAQIPVAQCIPVFDDSLKPKMIGFIRYWKERDIFKNEDVVYVHAYDAKGKQEYTGKSVETIVPGKSEVHGYSRVPVIQFKISSDGSNFFDHVTQLIDFYDKIMSEDFADELARFAQAYLGMTYNLGNAVDEDTGETEVDKIKRDRIFQGLASDRAVTDQIAFITKNINAEFTKEAADRCERLIYEMLQLFNPNDDTFVQASGVAQKYKLLGFEYLVTSILTYFAIGLQDRIALVKKLNANMAATGEQNTDVTIDFKRNLPDDLVSLAEIASKLKDVLSDETILRLFPTYVVEDVDDELSKIKDQKDKAIEDFMNQQANTNPDEGGDQNAQPGA
jgi:SPP1 family phage portal protein